jgi:hypothetical protein
LICVHIPALAPAQVLVQVKEPVVALVQVLVQAEKMVLCLLLAKQLLLYKMWLQDNLLY